MQASGASLGSSSTFEDKATVAALPYSAFFAAKHCAILYMVHEGEVAFFVSFFGECDIAIHGSDFGETFFCGNGGKVGIVFGPLFVFTGSGSCF